MPTPDRPQRPEILPEVKNIVAVSSGKGGVGKTTVSVNLAVSLAKQGAAVGLLDADIYGPNVPIMMGSTAQPRAMGQKILPLENHNVKFMSLGLIAGENAPIIWRGPIVGRMIQQFIVDVIWGALDYLVVDLPPGTGDAQLTLAQTVPLSGAVIVTTPQNVALEDVHRGIEMFRKVEVPILGIVENMSYFLCPCCGDHTPLFGEGGGQHIADAFGLPLLGQIPIQPNICEGGDTGAPIATGENNAFPEIARRIANALEERESDLPEITIV
ncbi:MAG: Mrp/NBP35 family ATP-binding protein [Gemmatimonadetes bacterium]|nr:Mrp/NBP35 family ATP-binding protein [Gemmatimonadota bacterium]